MKIFLSTYKTRTIFVFDIMSSIVCMFTPNVLKLVLKFHQIINTFLSIFTDSKIAKVLTVLVLPSFSLLMCLKLFQDLMIIRGTTLYFIIYNFLVFRQWSRYFLIFSFFYFHLWRNRVHDLNSFTFPCFQYSCMVWVVDLNVNGP